MRTLLCALALTCALGAAEGAFADVSHEELLTAIKAKTVVIIDVNGSASYAESHVPGALDFAVIKGDLAKSLPEDKNTLVIAYCGGPQCGAWKQAATAVAALGYTNVKHYSAGISGWSKQQAN